jgi:thioredoxin:protein disulfide reductase
MKPTKIVLVAIASALALIACAPSNQPVATPAASPVQSVEKQIRSADVVKAVVSPVSLSAGETGEALVQLTIQQGYHVNANPPTYAYLKATALEVPGATGISLTRVTYPKGLERTFPFAEKPLAVYEGTVDLKATLKADKSATPGQQSIPAHLRIQACDEQVCYPPGTLELTIPVQVK